MKKITLTVLLIILAVLAAKSEETGDTIVTRDRSILPKFGVFGRYNFNLHTANFRKLPDIPCCSPKFGTGFGSGFTAGGLFDYFFTPEYFLQLRASYGLYGAELIKEETTAGIVDGASTDVLFEHRIDSRISVIGLEPMFGYKINDNLFAFAGIRLGYVFTKEFDQIEEIIKPTDRGVFKEEGTRTRNEYSGEIPDASSFQASLQAGISCELPLKKDTSLILAPEFFYNFWITSVSSGLGWNIHTFSAGVSLKYKQPPPPPPPPAPPLLAPYPPMPSPPGKPELSFDIKVIQLDSNNTRQEGLDIKIEDFITYNMRPLLNYIFFEHNSADIPARYKRLTPLETNDFNLAKLHSLDVLPTYYHILNIIGKRLKDNPESNITLVGTNSGQSEEKNNLELSRKRALSVRDYLNRTWGIQDEQISISARNLPREASNPDEEGGNEENRRVEILSSDLSIIEPVMTIDTMRQISKTTLRFIPEVKAEAGLEKWKLTIKQANKVLKEFSGASTLPDELNWTIATNDENSPKTGEPIEYNFSVIDNFGSNASTPAKHIPVFKLTIDQKRQKSIRDREFEYYSLILFDFGKASLGREHRRVLDFIKGRIKPESEVIITGYSDKIGEEEINKKLSERRAKEAARKLDIKSAKVMGIGEKNLLYDNDLPEGRFYCRTVKITIETPVENGDGQ